jgi:hypothetical protein
LTGKALENAVVEYLSKSNRPHSEKEVWENMHKPIAQTKLKALLMKLSKGDDIDHLENGKFNVFWASQHKYDEYDPETISKLEKEADVLRLQVVGLKKEVDILNKDIGALNSRPTMSALREQLGKCTEELQAAQKRSAAREGAPPIDLKAREKLIKKGKEYLKLWKTRKDNMMDVVDNISEGMGKKPKKFCDELDLETTIGIKPVPYNVIKEEFKKLSATANGSIGYKRKR